MMSAVRGNEKVMSLIRDCSVFRSKLAWTDFNFLGGMGLTAQRVTMFGAMARRQGALWNSTRSTGSGSAIGPLPGGYTLQPTNARSITNKRTVLRHKQKENRKENLVWGWRFPFSLRWRLRLRRLLFALFRRFFRHLAGGLQPTRVR